MPVQIQQLTSEVLPLETDMPLSAEQIERLIQLILRRLEQQQRSEQHLREATALHTGSLPPLPIVE